MKMSDVLVADRARQPACGAFPKLDSKRDCEACLHGSVERNRLGRELHDSTSQLLVALQLHFGSLRDQLVHGTHNSTLLEIDDAINHLHQEIKAVSRINAAPAIKVGALPVSLRTMAQTFGALTGLSVAVHVEGRYEQRSCNDENSLFRIAQESLANIWRHAHARHVRILLRSRHGSLRMVIEDDGIGMPSSRSGGKGSGLSNMRARVRELDGRLSIRRLACGSRITVML